jgi:hypothetical protein
MERDSLASTTIVHGQRDEPIGVIEATGTGIFWDRGSLTRSTGRLNWLTTRRRSTKPTAQESLHANHTWLYEYSH